jgi:hypothetical protein
MEEEKRKSRMSKNEVGEEEEQDEQMEEEKRKSRMSKNGVGEEEEQDEQMEGVGDGEDG